jgi:hypothetical protein
MTHECDLPTQGRHGEFHQCSTCGWWHRMSVTTLRSPSGDIHADYRYHRLPRWWAKLVVGHRERKIVRQERKAARRANQAAKRIARHQASKSLRES